MPDSGDTASSSVSTGGTAARPYRSKKQRPCDSCRRRRVGCFVELNQKDCTLCRHRGTSCTFDSAAPVKRGRSAKSELINASDSGAGDSAADAGASGIGEQGTCPNRSILPRVRSQVVQPAEDDEVISSESHRRTVVPGRTVLYTGNSSDQDVYLLRHLPFDHTNSFGHSNWRVWKIFPHEAAPAYFTSYPNALLDANRGMYDVEKVDIMVKPHQRDLLDLYYIYVHPSLPILEDRGQLEASISGGAVPASLVAAVYCSAIAFWHRSPTLKHIKRISTEALYDFIFTSVTLEARTPNLRTIQAMLLYMQIPPLRVREPNHPGFWALTCQLVALAQDTGLHVEPASWNISSSEKKTRRILWWAVYMHDKWLSHWLGRPSHIDDRQFSTAPLTVEDFEERQLPRDDYLSHSISAFVMLTRLTTVLATVLEGFYTIKRNPCVMSPEEALSHASRCQTQLNECLELQGGVLQRPNRVINDYAFVFAYYGIAVSIQRALFACVGGTSYYDIERETILFQDLSEVFEDLLKQDVDGLWLSYCKSNIAMIGSFIITALLSSTDDEVYRTRRSTLDGFRLLLYRLAERFEFAALPLLRLNLLLERFTENGNGSGGGGGGPGSNSGVGVMMALGD